MVRFVIRTSAQRRHMTAPFAIQFLDSFRRRPLWRHLTRFSFSPLVEATYVTSSHESPRIIGVVRSLAGVLVQVLVVGHVFGRVASWRRNQLTAERLAAVHAVLVAAVQSLVVGFEAALGVEGVTGHRLRKLGKLGGAATDSTGARCKRPITIRYYHCIICYVLFVTHFDVYLLICRYSKTNNAGYFVFEGMYEL